jgi:hypothetical protein
VRKPAALIKSSFGRSLLHAHQDLVRRLDGYEVEQPEIFGRVIEFIEGKMMPIVVRHAVSGIANINSEDLLFEDPTALAMALRRMRRPSQPLAEEPDYESRRRVRQT